MTVSSIWLLEIWPKWILEGGGSRVKGRAWVGGVRRAEHPLPEEEEEAAADQLHLQALLDVAVKELQQLGDVGEREDQQGDFQLAEGEHTESHTHCLTHTPSHTHAQGSASQRR